MLPEYHLTSWCPENPAFASACTESTAFLARYQALARELNINIVPGTICEVHPASSSSPEDKGEIRNMAYFVAAGTGAIAGAYQKKNLWHPERPHLTAGAHAPHSAFDTPLVHADGRTPVRAGLLICWDLAFPEAFRALVADGAEIVFIPSFWYLTDVDDEARALNPDCEKLFLETTAVARAFENTRAVVFVNSAGLSQVAMPIVGALGKGPVEVGKEEMRVVDVDLGVLDLAERNYLVRKDMGGEGWHYAYTLFKGEREK
jgi:predicted amidohydrolase